VLPYEQLDRLPVDGDAVSIDMSGDAGVLAGVHAHFGDRLKYSMIIGRSHHDAPPVEVTGGPTPLLFFAPSEIDRRMAEWGPEEYARRTADALRAFVGESHRWLQVERTEGAAAGEAAYQEVYAGKLPPHVGRIVSMHD
jgi:hypothetical protein